MTELLSDRRLDEKGWREREMREEKNQGRAERMVIEGEGRRVVMAVFRLLQPQQQRQCQWLAALGILSTSPSFPLSVDLILCHRLVSAAAVAVDVLRSHFCVFFPYFPLH